MKPKLIYAGVFLAGVVFAGMVRKLPVIGSKIPALG